VYEPQKIKEEFGIKISFEEALEFRGYPLRQLEKWRKRLKKQ
jgi:acyl carrier protein